MSAHDPVGTQPPAVALLFENAAQSAHLRAALLALGADIVLEGPATDVDAETLGGSGAHVVVINLDAEVEQHLDRIQDALDTSGQRVVYNDGDASGKLSGWDQARWARHLAAKLMDQFDTDPPRPQNARPLQVDLSQASVDMNTAQETDALRAVAGDTDPGQDGNADASVCTAADNARDDAHAGELGVLMAEGEDILAELQAEDASAVPRPARDPDPQAPAADAAEAVSAPPRGETFPDTLSLADPDQGTPSTDAGHGHAATADKREPASPQAPEWELLATDAEPGASQASDDIQVRSGAHEERSDPASFGIHKVSAAEYLTPAGDEAGASPIEPGVSLELVSLEESIAPTMVEDAPANAMSLDVSTGLDRLVIIGATADSTEAVRDFLCAMGPHPNVAMLLIQHLADASAEALRVRLAEVADIPVRMAEHDAMVRRGELTVIPGGRQPDVDRSGRMRLDDAGDSACDPSIDAGFSAAAAQFGTDALAILLVDDANDAVAGAQAIHDRGGRVWLHQHALGKSSLMVSMLRQEGLVDLEDTPEAFAARLLEEAGEL